MPKPVKITSAEVREALSELVREIVEAVRSVPEKTPPEREADLIDWGRSWPEAARCFVDSILLLGEVIGIPAVAEARRAALTPVPIAFSCHFTSTSRESGGRA